MPRPVYFLLRLSLFLKISAVLCALQEYTDCSSPLLFRCGEERLNVSYPFTTATRKAYCGVGEHYDLKCQEEGDTYIPVIEIDGRPYRVKNIDYEAGVLTISDLEIAKNACDPRPYGNAALDGSLFEYTPDDLNFTIYYNCSPVLFGSFPWLREVPCLALPGRSSYLTEGYLPDPLVMGHLHSSCSLVSMIPFRGAAAVSLDANGSASIQKAVAQGFDVWWKAGDGWCEDCLRSGGACGHNSSEPEAQLCFCLDDSRAGSCASSKDISRRRKKIILGIVTGGSGFLLACIILCCLRYKKNSNACPLWAMKSRDSHNIEAFLEQYGSTVPKRYPYSEVKKMTKSFSDKLGQGGFGAVFKGELQDGRLVAVKVLNKSNENGEDFINEVASIGRTQHVNIVRLLGFCYERSKRALLYEFMPNGSLEKFIFSTKQGDPTLLGWEKLLEISIGIARGLEYLHRGCNTRIVHFDIKPHNILLDEDFCPKVSDFGLAKACHPKQSILSRVETRGTIGYIAPEVFSRKFGVISSKSDVYSYGMMVLEMVGGRKNADTGMDNTSEIYFPHWIYEHFNEDDGLKFRGITGETEEVARKMILVGLWCIQTSPSVRPSMTKVVEMLEGKNEDLNMPPKPYLCSP